MKERDKYTIAGMRKYEGWFRTAADAVKAAMLRDSQTQDHGGHLDIYVGRIPGAHTTRTQSGLRRVYLPGQTIS